MSAPRRVVTGLDADGRSSTIFDGPAPGVIWAAPSEPADNRGDADSGGGDFGLPTRGSVFSWFDFPPGFDSGMHATDTLDYVAVVAGEVVFATETGETVLRAGDVVVDRGVLHAWRNEADAPCRLLVVNCAALPVGAGATMR